MPRFRWAETRVNENCGEKGPVPQVSAPYPRAKAYSFVILSPWRGAELFLLAGAIYRPAVVPAKAGTHNPGLNRPKGRLLCTISSELHVLPIRHSCQAARFTVPLSSPRKRGPSNPGLSASCAQGL
jgi:hypothetical protein